MKELDRTFVGAMKEIYRLSDEIKQLKQDNKFLTEQLEAIVKERNALRASAPMNHEMGQ